VTGLFSLGENAIAKEPGSGYPKLGRCVSRLGLVNGGLDSLESSPYVTLSWGAFSASSLVTPICAATSRNRVVPVCNTDLSLPTPPHTALVDRGRTASQKGPWLWRGRLRAE
jgi:hypothetical protein